MRRSIRLRGWQHAALERFRSSADTDFLAVATPGAGKTRFALTAALHELGAQPGRRLVVVTPTHHLKMQWTAAAAGVGLQLEPSWSGRDGRLPPDMHGVVVTYQQVASSGPILASVADGAVVILDEVHHAAEDRAWGDALATAFASASRRLSLSGTPFRSDTQAIPFLRYADDEAWPDYSYGYAEALADGGVVRPVFFPRLDGEMEWEAADGSRHRHTFADQLAAERANQRLRTALSLDGQWLPTVLDRAHEQLTAIRRVHPAAGGLVIAMDTAHARGIAAVLQGRLGVDPVVATSEDPDASARIAGFGRDAREWIVAVRMVSEGVDIPRLRVGVYATNVTTELFFRQAVGRLVRWTNGLSRQKAFLFVPDDERLRAHAMGIAEERRHNLRRRPDAQAEEDGQLLDVSEPASDEGQLSLFSAISAVAIGDDPVVEVDDEHAAEEEGGSGVTVDVPAPPPLLGHGDEAGGSRQQRKRSLRDWNADRVRTLASVTGRSHAAVNRELNRLVGLERVTQATVHQLEERLRYANAWLRRV